MSFLDKMKEAGDKASKQVAENYKEHQEKVAERNDARGNKIGFLSVEYMGGFDDKKKAPGILTFYQKQTDFKSVMSTKFTLDNVRIKDIAIEGKDEVNRRVTVTRLLAVGIFAFALKKKSADKQAYLTIELTDGQEIIFLVDKKSPMELKTKLAKVISQVKQSSIAAQPPTIPQEAQGSVADEITKLAALKESGILTQAEFDQKKKQLLEL